MPYDIEFTRAAERELRRIPRGTQERIGNAINALANVPRPPGAVQLEPGLFRIRVGDYRVLYAVDDSRDLVVIARIRSRGSVYQRRYRP